MIATCDQCWPHRRREGSGGFGAPLLRIAHLRRAAAPMVPLSLIPILGLLLTLLLPVESARAGVPGAGELMICSPTAEVGPHPGLVVSVDLEDGIMRIVSYPAEFDEPRAITWSGQKQVYVADDDRIIIIDPYGGPLAAPSIFEHPYLRRVTDIEPDGAGGFYVLDELSMPLGDGGRGAILHFDPAREELTLLSNDFRLGGPTDLCVEENGSLLVLDPLGKPQAGAERIGAIFRLDLATAELTTLLSIEFAVDPAAVLSLGSNTLLLVDADATVPGFKEFSGAVLKLDLGTQAIVETLAVEEFRDPRAALIDHRGHLVVLDPHANPGGYATGGGALFEFDPQSGDYLGAFHHLLFEDLAGLGVMGGAELSESIVRLEDPDDVPLPGDHLEFEVALVNTGIDLARDVVVTADLRQLLCFAPDLIIDDGELEFDQTSGALRWEVDAPVGDTLRLVADVQIPWETGFGTWLRVPVTLSAETDQENESLVLRVVTLASPGDIVYTDAGSESPAPRLFYFDEDEDDFPLTLELETPEDLGVPSDVTFGPDGMLYVLDGRFGSCGLLKIDPASGAITVLHRGAPLTHARGLCWGHDGSLLIADPHLPRQYAATGAIYRFDLQSGEMAEFFRDDDFTDPVDICPDRYGHYMVADYSATTNGHQGALIEIDEAGGRFAVYSSIYLRDPISVDVARNGDVFVSDIGFADAPSPWAVTKIDRSGPQPSFSAIALVTPNPLRRPYGIAALTPTQLQVCEREKNPFANRSGAIVEFTQQQGTWQGGFVSFDETLCRPERLAQFRLPELLCQSLDLSDVTGGQLLPGDTLVAEVWLNNRSAVPAPEGLAMVQAAYPLRLIGSGVDRGELALDPHSGSVQWRGIARYQDPIRWTTTFVVDALAPHGEQIEVRAEIPGSSLDPLRVWRTISAPLQGGELLVLDSTSDPFGQGHQGAIYHFAEEEDELNALTSYAALVAPSDLWCRGTDEALLVDRDADPLLHGNAPGALFAIDPSSGGLRIVSAAEAFREPVRVRPHPDGGYLVLDRLAQPCGGAGVGAVFHVTELSGAVDTLVCAAALRAPMDMAIDAQRRLWITDAEANPLDLGIDDTGAIFVADLDTGALLDTLAGRDYVSPAAIEILRDGKILFADLGWTGPFGNLGIRRLDPNDASLATILNSPYLRTPTRLVQRSAGEIWLVDSTGWFPGYEGENGMVFRFDPAGSELAVQFPGPPTARLEAVSRVPLPELAIVRMTAAGDAAGRYVAPGDTLDCELVLANQSGTPEPAVLLQLEIGATLALDPGSLAASTGAAGLLGDGWIWEGSLAGGDSVTIRYRLTPQISPGLPSWGDQVARADGYLAEPIERRVSHHISTTVGPSELLVIDSWADPRGYGFATGAIFRLEGSTREAAPILADSAFVSPVAVALVPGSQTELLIVDADATVGGGVGRGALLRANTWTGEVELLFSDPTMSQPGALAVLDSTACFVLDEMADPYDLEPAGGLGPGAIYLVDPRTGAGGVFFSDTLFVRPVDIDVDPLTGTLFVIDKRAGGTGQHAGSVIEIDATGTSAEVLHAGAPFFSPRCLVLTETGDLLIVDPFPLGGMLFRMDREGNLSSETIACGELVAPTDIVIGSRGRPLVIDAQGDPLHYGPPMGAVLRFFFDGEMRHCSIYRTGPPFARPRGACIHFEGATPIQLVSLEMIETAYGVELRWLPPPLLAGADHFVYRRETEAAQNDYVCLNRGSALRGNGELVFVDPLVEAGRAYEYLLLAIARDGSRSEFGPFRMRAQGSPGRFALAPPAPNPCILSAGRGVMLRYQVPVPGGEVRLSVFDLGGRLIHDLVSEHRSPGAYTLLWNARDRRGSRVDSGLYFLRLQAGHRQALRRLLLIR